MLREGGHSSVLPRAPQELPQHSPTISFPQPPVPWDEMGGSRAVLGETPRLCRLGCPRPGWLQEPCTALGAAQQPRLRFGTLPSLPRKGQSQHSSFWEWLLLNSQLSCCQPPPELSSCAPIPAAAPVEKLTGAGPAGQGSQGHICPLLCWGSSP